MNYPITVIQSSWRARQSQRPSFYYPPLNLPKQVKYLAREFRAGISAGLFGTVPAVVIGGLGTVTVVGLWMWLFPPLRRVDRFTDVQPKSEMAARRLGPVASAAITAQTVPNAMTSSTVPSAIFV